MLLQQQYQSALFWADKVASLSHGKKWDFTLFLINLFLMFCFGLVVFCCFGLF